jgi:hypothetical protein
MFVHSWKPAYLRQENDKVLLLSFSPRGTVDVKEDLEFLLNAAESTGHAKGGQTETGNTYSVLHHLGSQYP